MRQIDFSEWRKQRSRVLHIGLHTEDAFQDHLAGNRPRDPEQERILSQLDKARWKRYLESGKIEKLGPRRYRFRIDSTDDD